MKTAAPFLLLFVISSAAFAQPSLTLSAATIELGTIYHGDVRTVPLIVRNSGSQPLTILGVETSCGCTTAKRSSDPIPPGGADTISVSFNSLGFSGPVTKIVSVRTNDPSKPSAESRLTGTVTSLLETEPVQQVINLGSSPARTPKTVRLEFRNTSGTALKVTGFSSVDTTLRSPFTGATVDPNGTLILPLTFTPPTRSFVENYFHLHTTDPRQLKIPCRFMYIGQ